MMTLDTFLADHTRRGACQCGRCLTEPYDEVTTALAMHTADVEFFKVTLKGEPSRDEFLRLVREECPSLLDGAEHSYIEIGGMVGDQGEALVLMGAGAVLGAWTLRTPRSVFGKLGLTADMLMNLAGQGLVTIQHKKEAL